MGSDDSLHSSSSSILRRLGARKLSDISYEGYKAQYSKLGTLCVCEGIVCEILCTIELKFGTNASQCDG